MKKINNVFMKTKQNLLKLWSVLCKLLKRFRVNKITKSLILLNKIIIEKVKKKVNQKKKIAVIFNFKEN